MQQWIASLMNYPGITFLMFLENVFPPLPSELIMPLAGFQAAQGTLTLWGVILAGSLGALVGQLPLYYLGKRLGKDRLEAWVDKHGHWLAVSRREIENADTWFKSHGTQAVLIGRLIPGVRSLVSLPAGFAEMNLAKFLAYSAVGTTLWAGILVWLGALLGSRYDQIEKYVGPIAFFVLGGLFLWFIGGVVKRKAAKAAKKG